MHGREMRIIKYTQRKIYEFIHRYIKLPAKEVEKRAAEMMRKRRLIFL